MLPTRIAEMSLRISPNRFEPTTTSKLSGRRMKFMAAASTSSDSVSMCGKLRRHVLERAVPQHHAVALRVGLGDRGDALLLVALHRQLEGEAHDALDAAPREHRGLDGDLFRLHLVDEAAHLRVLALGVLAHHDEIDVAALAAAPAANSRPDRDTPAARWRTGRRRAGWAAAGRSAWCGRGSRDAPPRPAGWRRRAAADRSRRPASCGPSGR